MPTEHTSGQRWILYGANGFTGRLCAEEAVRRGLRPVLAGRTRASVDAVAEPLGLETAVFTLDRPEAVAEALAGAQAVLNCAGPFSRTAAPMVEGCARSGAHYLDITGEIPVFEDIHGRNERWRSAGITAIPGVGFDVVPTDCLAAMLKRDLPDATRLRLALKWSGRVSPGTARTTFEHLPEGGRVRRDGVITAVPLAHQEAQVIFESEPEPVVSAPWGDVSTAFYSTGIPHIEVFMAVTPSQLQQIHRLRRLLPLLGLGPVRQLVGWWIKRRNTGNDAAQRGQGTAWVWGEVSNASGRKATRRMRTPDPYGLTAEAAVAAVARVLEGSVETGALTPSQAFGPEFAFQLKGVTAVAGKEV